MFRYQGKKLTQRKVTEITTKINLKEKDIIDNMAKDSSLKNKPSLMRLILRRERNLFGNIHIRMLGKRK